MLTHCIQQTLCEVILNELASEIDGLACILPESISFRLTVKDLGGANVAFQHGRRNKMGLWVWVCASLGAGTRACAWRSEINNTRCWFFVFFLSVGSRICRLG